MNPHDNIDDDDNDDDDAPVEVSKKFSEQQARENFKQEKLAKNFIDEKLKQKRRRELERNVEQKKMKIEKLPEDFLKEIETEYSAVTEMSDTNIRKVDPTILKKNKREKKKLAKSKTVTTQTTKYEILSLDELIETAKAPIIQTNACNFREQILFDKNKNCRRSSRKMMAIRQKIRACSKK
ncbi:hypothetical protein DERF_012002 [Dermatophagoides farinae]|uniref:Uncharacterized protein n=1 Tax=Dermatophagoides farinae TaxID=6954 RepID=A0A922HNS7_DERFA|nr:hypothetical protein DERF_012002 [Dermatophagoides farinae]